MKKTYEIELKYESYTVITVEADNAEEAEQLAWTELESDGAHRSDYGNWSVESVEEMKGESK